MSVPDNQQTLTTSLPSKDTMIPSIVDDTTTPPPPERFPAEVFDRIIKHLGNQPTPAEHHEKSKPGYKSKYPALFALQQTSRAMYLRATPYMYKTYESDLLGFTMLLEQFDPITVDEVEEAIYRPDREGHPIEWTYATRLLWMMSHLECLIYRPIIQWDFWEWQNKLASPKVPELQSHLDALGTGHRLTPLLTRLAFDTSRYEGEFSDLASTRLLGKGHYSSRYPSPNDVNYSERHRKQRERDGLPLHDMARSVGGQPLVKSLVALAPSKHSFCLRGPRGDPQVYNLANRGEGSGFSPENSISGDTVILHDFSSLENENVYGGSKFFDTSNIIWSSFSPYLPLQERTNEVGYLTDTSFPGVKRILVANPKLPHDQYRESLDLDFFGYAQDDEQTEDVSSIKWGFLEDGPYGYPICECCGGE